MKPVVFHIENHNIAYKINWLGIESVSIDDVQISKKLSLPQRKHRFTLDVYGKIQPFYIKTKQSFSSGKIIVQLFHDNVLIDEGRIAFDFAKVDHKQTTSDNSMLTTGLMFVVFSMIFGWSKFFLFIGLVCLFSSFFGNAKHEQSSENSNDTYHQS